MDEASTRIVAAVAAFPSFSIGSLFIQDCPSDVRHGISRSARINAAHTQESGRDQASRRVPSGTATTAAAERTPAAKSNRIESTPAASRNAAVISRPLGFTDAARNQAIAGSASNVASRTMRAGNRRARRNTPKTAVSKLRMAEARRAP